jgi:hypothetical protein
MCNAKLKINVAVIGGYKCSGKFYKIAREVGCLIARQGWILICGGREGVMEAACRGAKEAGGLTVGILPSSDAKDANKYVEIKIPTGLGYARNVLVIRAADAVIAIDGNYGTLSEIAFAFNDPKPIVGIGTWKIKGLKQVATPEAAIRYIKRKVKTRRR